MTRSDAIFAVDEYNHWYVFDKRKAVGKFGKYADAKKLRDSLPGEEAK